MTSSLPGNNVNTNEENWGVSSVMAEGEGGGGGGLSECLVKKASRELNEKPEFRERDIQALREMVQGEKDLHCPIDDAFLLRFLRAKKFDADRSFALLTQYYRIRAKYPEMYDRFRPSALTNVFQDNMQTFLRHRDQLGCRIFLFRLGKWDPSRSHLDDVFLANQMLHEVVIREEETQISGIVAIVDMNGLSWNHVKQFGPSNLKKFASLLQDAFPARFKGFHVIHEPAVFNILFAIAWPFLNEKLRKRVFLHGSNLDSLHSHFSPEILPEELGGLLPKTDNSEFVRLLVELEDEFVRSNSQFGYIPADANKNKRQDAGETELDANIKRR